MSLDMQASRPNVTHLEVLRHKGLLRIVATRHGSLKTLQDCPSTILLSHSLAGGVQEACLAERFQEVDQNPAVQSRVGEHLVVGSFAVAED